MYIQTQVLHLDKALRSVAEQKEQLEHRGEKVSHDLQQMVRNSISEVEFEHYCLCFYYRNTSTTPRCLMFMNSSQPLNLQIPSA